MNVTYRSKFTAAEHQRQKARGFKRVSLLFYSTALLVMMVVSGCAVAPSRPNYQLIDPKGVDYVKYERDYMECARLANQTDVAASAVGGAIFGALIGAIVGGALCGQNCARDLSAWGAGTGAAGGAGGGVREQQTALRRCLIGRGYNVIR